MAGGDNTTGMGRSLEWLGRSFMADRARWFLWSPVFLAAGAALYFALPFEPSRERSWAAFAVGAIVWLAIRQFVCSAGWRVAAMAAVLCAGGFCAGVERTARVMAPMLSMPTGPVMVAGRVADVDLADKGPRVVLDHVTIEGLAPDATPRKVRLRLTRYAAVPLADSTIAVRAVLMPSPGPAQPGAHDFRRDAFFDGIGGVGYAIGYAHVLRGVTDDPAWLPRLRAYIDGRVERALGKTPEAAIATAYLTGARGLIDEQTATDMRNSGLAHLLAISGMKIGLVAVLVFAATRLVLSLFPALALRVPVRKIAACTGIVAAIAYTALASAPVPALRSALMTSMAMVAILFDRQSFSLRLAAVAAICVLILFPESAISVSFQMSFGAVVALIAFYEAYRHRIAAGYRTASPSRRFFMDLCKILLTTLVATLVTAPLALMHFQQEANYSIPANAFAIPLNDFWIMPCAVLAVVLMPVHMDGLPLAAMGAGIRVMLRVAHGVSQLPGAVTHVPLLPASVLALASLGGLWIILWRQRWRRLGLVPIVAAVVLACLGERPDILVSEDSSHAAVRLADGTLAISRQTRKDFTADSWDRLNGSAGVKLLDDGTIKDAMRCDKAACLERRGPTRVAILRDPAAASDACDGSDIVISRWPLQVRCDAKIEIDPTTTSRTGAVAVYLKNGAIRLETAHEVVGDRPWWVSTGAAGRPADPEP